MQKKMFIIVLIFATIHLILSARAGFVYSDSIPNMDIYIKICNLLLLFFPMISVCVIKIYARENKYTVEYLELSVIALYIYSGIFILLGYIFDHPTLDNIVLFLGSFIAFDTAITNWYSRDNMQSDKSILKYKGGDNLKRLKHIPVTVMVITASFLIAIIVIENIITNGLFGWKPLNTSFSESEWFAFTASYLGAIGSIGIGSIALYQNRQYKKQADAYTSKMDDLMLLSEIYPTQIIKATKFNEFGKVHYAYYRFAEDDDRISELQIYEIEFIVVKNPVINLKLVSVCAKYSQESNVYAKKNQENNTLLCSGNIPTYNSVDSTFTIALGLPKVNKDINNPTQLPDSIEVNLKVQYENQYSMLCEKKIKLTLNEKEDRKSIGNLVYVNWDITQAQILSE